MTQVCEFIRTEMLYKNTNDIYKDINLSSVYLVRQRERTRLSGEFSKIYLKISKKDNLKDRINKKVSELVNNVMVDGKIINLDKKDSILLLSLTH